MGININIAPKSPFNLNWGDVLASPFGSVFQPDGSNGNRGEDGGSKSLLVSLGNGAVVKQSGYGGENAGARPSQYAHRRFRLIGTGTVSISVTDVQ